MFSRTIECKNKIQFYTKFISLINAVYKKEKQINDTQIAILAIALSLDGELNKNNRFNTTARAFIREKLKLGISNLTNNLKVLKDKNILYVNEHGNLAIHQSLLLVDDHNENMVVSFILKPSYVEGDNDIILETINNGSFRKEL